MYTNLQTYQIVIALLKQYGIKHCVLSAGSRNVPFVHSVEEDPYFTCYSVVDERSAAYFAIGLSQQLHEPVVISCTASTASSNYWPGVGEAFYQGVPLVVLTSDRNPSMLHQWEDQMIDQVGMFDRHVKKSVNLPIINDHDDWLFCQRLVNEALLELNHHTTGPVHINVPMKDYCNLFEYNKLPVVTKIERINAFSQKSDWISKVTKLLNCKRILVICGQNSYVPDSLNQALTTFFKRYNATIAVEHMSNIKCEGMLHTSICMDERLIPLNKFEDYVPDIVISLGYNVFQGIKELLRKCHRPFEHWSIQPDGSVVDMYLNLHVIFECPTTYFFEYCNRVAKEKDTKNDLEYYQQLKHYVDSITIPNFEYSNVFAIQRVVENIPNGSILHLSINNSIRLTNYFRIQPDVKVYANIGTYGIDGCLSTFEGQAAATNHLCFLIIGDLSFFYDMNALRIRHIKNNARILMINNQGGGEFYYNGTWDNEASDLHTTARHHTKAEGWVKENNFVYLSAHDKETFEKAYTTFMNESEKPIFFEVFTEMKKDADIAHKFLDMNRPKSLRNELIKKGKEIVKATLPNSALRNLRIILKK